MGSSGRDHVPRRNFMGAGTQMIRYGMFLPIGVDVKIGSLRYLVWALGERVELARRFNNRS